ncbi:MAG: hypothetical protein NTZ09_20730 [Candidatus Hydrogenedentes bacterium]|nr:hypothetical protein [Candidatus Hydrogenedentota bacterium]
MLDARLSGCINHPGIEATGRCKQCGTPFCGACEVPSANGRFCSAVCSEKYEQFTARARQLDKHAPRCGILMRLRILILKLAVWVIAIAAIVYGLAYFNLPGVGRIARALLELVHFYLPQ